VMFSIFETLALWDINQIQWLSDYFRACAVAGVPSVSVRNWSDYLASAARPAHYSVRFCL
jgi:hypothetical protein